MKYPQSIQNLINSFSNLPTVGPKTAERYVLYLLKKSKDDLKIFAQNIIDLKEKIKICYLCNSISETSPCDICKNSGRDKGIICIVRDTKDIISLELTKQFTGVYYVLGGLLNSIEGINPDQLNIIKLKDRISKEKNNIKELIIALSPTLEGETTSLYLIKLFQPLNLKITRLAKGLPMGSDLEYADEITLANALKYRR